MDCTKSGLLFLGLVTTLSYGAQPAGAAEPAPVTVEVFKAPELITRGANTVYPEHQASDQAEGWVQLNFMVDPEGVPYEPTIVDSSGNEAFEKAALTGIVGARYKPALSGNTPVPSSQDLKIYFLKGVKGARPTFIASYRQLLRALDNGDRAAAEALLEGLVARNLYEDAYRHLAKYNYDLKWGTEAEQLADLRRAVAFESKPNYLKRPDFVSVMSSKLRLEIKLQEYGSAQRTWEGLLPHANKDEAKDWRAIMQAVEVLRTNAESFRVLERIETGTSWHGRLLKNRFALEVMSGRVSEIKLRCEKQYLFFHYEPGTRYEISARDGRCSIEVVGDAGSSFDLIQS